MEYINPEQIDYEKLAQMTNTEDVKKYIESLANIEAIKIVDLSAWLKDEVRVLSDTVKRYVTEYNPIGTVEDNGQLGMLMAYNRMYRLINAFNLKATDEYKREFEKNREKSKKLREEYCEKLLKEFQ